MPELLLSSSPVTKNTSQLGFESKGGKVSLVDASGADQVFDFNKKEFNSIFQEMIQKTPQKQIQDQAPLNLDELPVTLEYLSQELHLLDINPEMLDQLQQLIEGHDFSSMGQNGGELPDFFKQLESLLADLYQLIEQTQTEAKQHDTTDILQTIQTLGIQIAHLTPEKLSSGTSLKAQNSISLFSTETGSWQSNAYQQASSGQTNAASQNLTLPAGMNLMDLTSQQGESDRAFQLHMDQALNELTDGADLAEGAAESLLQIKDKPLTPRFSDVQLRSINNGMPQYSTTLNTPVSGQEWGDELSQKIVWFTGRNIQAAEMHLNPAELGPIDVKIHMNNDVASLTFNVNNASVRDLLESSVVRLREMIEANGLNLGDVNIDSGRQDQQSGADSSKQGFAQNNHAGSENEEESVKISESEVSIKQPNLVDYFV